jgi:hypothetical protein
LLRTTEPIFGAMRKLVAVIRPELDVPADARFVIEDEKQFSGFNPAYLFRAATGKVEILAPDAFALGMFESACFESRKFYLEEGDLLIVYSDGLTDAENPQAENSDDTKRKI